ncbi:DUF1824 family protein [Gloeothece verrucosa]|uniref:DUF1824 domain-containing protein n=1 Tax=Gloeothece verrucosa (strain PCC 7822) TaxID=497965 RepID=E0U702_GLOV7|nr:DUF1824 family protein [Gloeothece verrucosa]ADN17158.1 Domain of unknown function DUF1824 [Gloeothece verrucosa PCC 7822]
MSDLKETNLTIEEALKLLREYSCIQVKTVDAKIQKEQLREALLLITSVSEYENIGVCANNAQEGLAALFSYLKAFGYQTNFEATEKFEEHQPVYIKYNTQKQSHYLDSYAGSYRGVLISCQADDDALVGTYGHFPLDLFM